jgi:predicted phosphoribosyltransferase
MTDAPGYSGASTRARMIFDDTDLKLLSLVLHREVQAPATPELAMALLTEARSRLARSTNPAGELCRQMLNEMERRAIGASIAIH